MVPNRPSQTAEAVCLMRASERLKPEAERVLDDPYAELFLGPMSRAALATTAAAGRLGRFAERSSFGLSAWVVCRHRSMDEHLAHALERPSLEQVVLLGAGYDTRAWRFASALAGRPVFEVDFPATSRRKQRIARAHQRELPATRVEVVEIDFQTQSIVKRLADTGFVPGRETFFVWEGVSMYLTRAAVKATLTALRELAGPRSELVMDYWHLPDSPDLAASAQRLGVNFLAFLGEPVTFGLHPEDAPHFMERLGWSVKDIGDPESFEKRYLHDGRTLASSFYVAHAMARAGAQKG